MKAYIWIPFALLLGLMIGGWGMRSELRKTKERLKNTRQLLREAKSLKGSADVREVTRMLGIGREHVSVEAQPAETSAQDESAAWANVPPDDKKDSQEKKGPQISAKTTEGEDNEETDSGSEMEKDINEAIELWKLRSDIARSTFIANAKLNEDEVIQFDVLIEAMNMRLNDKIDNWVKEVEEKEEIGPEEGIRLVSDVTDVLVLTYDEMDRTMPPNWRETGGEEMAIVDFIDPSVAKPFITVENKMGKADWGRQGRRRRKPLDEDISP